VVPYCTVGYRSGLYGRELMQLHGLPARSVRNGEGVLMWTFDGGDLVRFKDNGANVGLQGGAGVEEGRLVEGEKTHEVHCFGEAWDIAAPGFQTVYFSKAGGAWRFCCTSLRDWCKAKQRTLLLVFGCLLLYFALTPTCGLMYNCGCKMALTKASMVSDCNSFAKHPQFPTPDYQGPPCPWCSCKGFSCLFVGMDQQALKQVPLLDSLPNGFCIILITLLGVAQGLALLDRRFPETHPTLGKYANIGVCLRVLWPPAWLASYSILVGLLFWLATDYPEFLGFHKSTAVEAHS